MTERRHELLLDQPPSKPSILDSLLLSGKGDAAGRQKKRSSSADEDLKERPQTTALPPSQVLGKVKDFLGVMAKANEQLEREAQNGSVAKYDMEALSGNEKEYIQMDLLLGITDLHTDKAVAAAEAALTNAQPSVTSHSSSSSDSEDDVDDGDNDGIDAYHSQKLFPERDEALKKSKTDKKPKIVVLDQSSS